MRTEQRRCVARTCVRACLCGCVPTHDLQSLGIKMYSPGEVQTEVRGGKSCFFYVGTRGKVCMAEFSPDGGKKERRKSCWRDRRVKCSHPWQGCGRSDPHSPLLSPLSSLLSLPFSLLPLSPSPSSVSCAVLPSVQGTPAAGFWVYISISLSLGKEKKKKATREGDAQQQRAKSDHRTRQKTKILVTGVRRRRRGGGGSLSK